MPDSIALSEAKATAERRTLALRGAAERIAMCGDADRIIALLVLAGATRLARAIERARPIGPQDLDIVAMKPDASTWSRAADELIGSSSEKESRYMKQKASATM